MGVLDHTAGANANDVENSIMYVIGPTGPMRGALTKVNFGRRVSI